MSTGSRAAVRLALHCGGDWVQAASGETFESRSPATGEVLAIVPYAGPEDGRRAIEAAERARQAIAALGVE
jgi:acyl-CoA reductase-like NAD-dependent aldehyde dehydrogenase